MNLTSTTAATGSTSWVTVTWLTGPPPSDDPPPAGALVPRPPLAPAPPAFAAVAA